jgi:hypothetical protein
MIIPGAAFGFTLIPDFGHDSVMARGVWKTDTILPDRVFQLIPFVENDQPIVPQINPSITVIGHNPHSPDFLSLIRKLANEHCYLSRNRHRDAFKYCYISMI